MLIEIQNIPAGIGVFELKQLVGQHLAFKRFQAMTYARKYDQFSDSEYHSKFNINQQGKQAFKHQKNLLKKAYLEPVNFREAQTFIQQFNGRPMGFQVKVKTTNFKIYQDVPWTLRLTNESFDEINDINNHEEQRTHALDQHLLRYNKLHQEFLQKINTQIDDWSDEELEKQFVGRYEQKKFSEKKLQRCSFWEDL